MTLRSLRDRTCLVTGAASGIGRAVAQQAAREGAVLVLTDIQEVTLAQVADEIHAGGGKVAFTRALDIASFEAVKTFADDVHRALGSMDVVMNVAGIAIWGSVEALEHRHWKRCVDVNLMGPIHVIESFVPKMVEAGRGGHLVNVSSAAGLFGLPLHAAYSASKFGLRGISEVLRFDLARHGIGVSLVCPGAVHTGLVEGVQIVGVDVQHPSAKKLRARFTRHAVTPDVAAAAILRGIRRNDYMVYTSPDIRFGHFFQRVFSLPYEVVMRVMNDQLHRVTVEAGTKPSARS